MSRVAPSKRSQGYRGTPLPAALREALSAAGIATLQELARRVGWQPEMIFAVRCGRRGITPEMAKRLGQILGVPSGAVAALLRTRAGQP